MKVILAAFVAATVGADGAQALNSAPNPETQIAKLKAEIATPGCSSLSRRACRSDGPD
jgi:hypothetical protein